jgi:probable F420-dependent oxidoreductase
MKFTLQLPATYIDPPGEFQTAAAMREMAQAIEASGAAACWVTDHPAPDAEWLLDPRGHDALDPFTALAFAAAATTTLRLHVNVLVLPYRNPFITAKAAATLDVLSGGRLILGVGGGYQQTEFEALGVDFSKRGVLMDEALETMRLAWSGEVVVKKGRNFDATANLPRPPPAAPPTIWVGGSSDKALQRAAKWGDGWCPIYMTEGLRNVSLHQPISSVAALKAKVAELGELRAAQGRSGPVDIAINAPAPPQSATRAEADRFVDSLGALKDAGLTWICTGVAHPSRAAFLENVQWFGEEVIARV